MNRSFRLLFRVTLLFVPLTLIAGAATSNVSWLDRAIPPDLTPAVTADPGEAPTPAGFVVRVNLTERRLRVYDAALAGMIDDWTPALAEYRVAIGTKRYRTPLFDGAVVSKRPKPSWFVPRVEWAGELAGKIIPFSSRENPFRARNAEGRVEGYFIALGHQSIGLHSTREARSIGRLASHGCIRMNLDDVRALYHLLPHGTPVSTEYRLYRVEQSNEGVRIKVFEDVYHRFSREERRQALHEHLDRHGLAKEILRPEELASLLQGKDVLLADVTPHRIIDYDGRASSMMTASGSRDAARLLAHTIMAMPR